MYLDSHQHIHRAMRTLAASGKPIDYFSLGETLGPELARVGGQAYLTDLDRCMPRGMNVKHHVDALLQRAGARHLQRGLLAIAKEANAPTPNLALLREQTVALGQGVRIYEPQGPPRIATFEAIPDIYTLPVPPISWMVPGIIPASALTVIAGEPGVGKSFLAQKVAAACAAGTTFLGRECQQVPTLILDRENTQAIVRSRLDLLSGGPISDLRAWGGWVKGDPPPELDDPRLLRIVEKSRPLVIVDSLVRFCGDADENSASEMRVVLDRLRNLVNVGGTVLVLHHRGKGETAAAYRGSSDIAAAPELLLSLRRDDGLLVLRGEKNRISDAINVTIRADFAAGLFEEADSPALVSRRDEVATLAEIIAASPGLTQNKILDQCGINRQRATRLLKDNPENLWRREQSGREYHYFASVGGR